MTDTPGGWNQGYGHVAKRLRRQGSRGRAGPWVAVWSRESPWQVACRNYETVYRELRVPRILTALAVQAALHPVTTPRAPRCCSARWATSSWSCTGHTWQARRWGGSGAGP